MASITQNPGALVQIMHHVPPWSICTLTDKDIVGVNIREGITSMCPNFDPLCESE